MESNKANGFMQRLKQNIADNQEAMRYNSFLRLCDIKIITISGGVKIMHHPAHTAFILVMSFIFGPAMIYAILSGLLPLTDAPIFAWIIASLVTLCSAFWFFHHSYHTILKPAHIIMDFTSRVFKLNNPTTRHYYRYKEWPKEISADDIEHFTATEETDQDGDKYYDLSLFFKSGGKVILLTTYDKERRDRLVTILYVEMHITEKRDV